jgi:purine-cytosine permease-like protein
MIRLLRLALQIVLFFLLLSLVVAVGSAQTGIVEKVALIAVGLVVVWLASRVRRIGAPVRQS